MPHNRPGRQTRSVSKAVGEISGHGFQQGEIKVRAIGDIGTKRVEGANFGARALGHGFDDPWRELRLGKDANGTFVRHHGLDFAQAPGAGGNLGIDGKAADRLDIEPFFKILVCVVEHKERLAPDGIELGVDIGFEVIDPGDHGGAVGAIGLSVFRIGSAQRIGNCGKHHPGIFGIEPNMGVAILMVMPLFVVVVIFILFMILIFMGFMIMVVVSLLEMFVFFEQAAFARLQQRDPIDFEQFDALDISGQIGKRSGKEGFEPFADPENDVGIFECAGLRGPERITMRATATLDEQFGRCHTVHHTGHKRMDRFDGCDNVRRGGDGGRKGKKKRYGQGESGFQHCDARSKALRYVITLRRCNAITLHGVSTVFGRGSALSTLKRDDIVRVEGIGVRREGRWLVRGVDLRISKGEIVTLIGPNGSGKSTTVKTALGIVKPDEGRVWRAPGLTIGYVPQKIAMDRSLPMTVERLLRLTGSHDSAEIHAILATVGIAHLAKAQVQALSGGEFQRALIARAIIGKPDLLVLDEPVQGVDFSGEVALYDLIGRIRDETGCGILLISHDLHVVMARTDTVVCLNGHVCCQGTPDVVAASGEYAALFGPRAAETLAIYRHEHDHAHLPDGSVRDADGHLHFDHHAHSTHCAHDHKEQADA